VVNLSYLDGISICLKRRVTLPPRAILFDYLNSFRRGREH